MIKVPETIIKAVTKLLKFNIRNTKALSDIVMIQIS